MAESILMVFAHDGVEILSPMQVAARQMPAGAKCLPSKEDAAVSHHKIVDHHENVEHLHASKERLDERKRSASTIEEIHREHHLKKGGRRSG